MDARAQSRNIISTNSPGINDSSAIDAVKSVQVSQSHQSPPAKAEKPSIFNFFEGAISLQEQMLLWKGL